MKAGDLPIYGGLVDEKKEYVLVPKPDSKIRSYLYSIITPTRQSIVDWYGTAESNSQKSVKFVVEKSMSVYKHIEDDPVILARGGFITVCGLGGIVLGSKGGVLRQIAYGCLGAGGGTVMCYPNCSLKAINYAWDAGTGKLLESTEMVKRKFKE
ncbi:unnamed protein product [Rodentolepis nana]|uniref:MICOS complex subunit n=1 Tax=Rodentolepis nana TaxID=102285 RepID=A0A0R3T0M0_RODNA|nr:unnamed protein product [Rodentolepis nana]